MNSNSHESGEWTNLQRGTGLPDRFDLLLSSGFLAFARHVGLLSALDELGLAPQVGAVCGTSSGALVGALWAAGHPVARLEELIASVQPWRLLRPQVLQRPTAAHRGLFSTHALQAWLSDWIPERFEDLPRPFAVGVRSPDRSHALLTTGSLPAAVAASCAMPAVFAPVEVGGVWYQDGGAVDRVGYRAWQQWRPGQAAVVHWIDRTAGKDVQLPPNPDTIPPTIVRSERSGASFFSLGNVAGQVEATKAAVLRQLAVPVGGRPGAG